MHESKPDLFNLRAAIKCIQIGVEIVVRRNEFTLVLLRPLSALLSYSVSG